MERAPTAVVTAALTLLAGFGCAVDASGLGGDQREADGGSIGDAAPEDGATPEDGALPEDGGAIPDGGGPADGGPERDGGSSPDASSDPDLGAADAFQPVDAGVDACVPAGPDLCNGRDDDCDGAVDEACPDPGGGNTTCDSHLYAGHVYLFCTETDGGDAWEQARDECEDRGYDLVQIDDSAERAFLASHAGEDHWWTGARTDANGPGRRDADNWTWRPGGGVVDAGLWGSNEPSGNGQCAYLDPRSSHHLDDEPCRRGKPFVCEAVVRP